MRRSPKNFRIAFDDAGLTHYGGVFFFHEFIRVLQFSDPRVDYTESFHLYFQQVHGLKPQYG